MAMLICALCKNKKECAISNFDKKCEYLEISYDAITWRLGEGAGSPMVENRTSENPVNVI